MSPVSFDLVSSILNNDSHQTSENIKLNNQNNVSSQSTYYFDSLMSLTNNKEDISPLFIGFMKPYKTFIKPNTEMLTAQDVNLKESFNNVSSNLSDDVKDIFKSTLSSAGSGALSSGGKSLFTNTISYAMGKEKINVAGANVVGTTVKGAISGAGGGLVSSVSKVTIKLIGFTGTPLMVADILGSAVGSTIGNKIYDSSGIGKKIKSWFKVSV